MLEVGQRKRERKNSLREKYFAQAQKKSELKKFLSSIEQSFYKSRRAKGLNEVCD